MRGICCVEFVHDLTKPLLLMGNIDFFKILLYFRLTRFQLDVFANARILYFKDKSKCYIQYLIFAVHTNLQKIQTEVKVVFITVFINDLAETVNVLDTLTTPP